HPKWVVDGDEGDGGDKRCGDEVEVMVVSHGGDGARCGDDDDGGVDVVRRRCGGGLVVGWIGGGGGGRNLAEGDAILENEVASLK
ncbi:hypothetical protein Tco_0786196, partial [Tanacetum coccineum]